MSTLFQQQSSFFQPAPRSPFGVSMDSTGKSRHVPILPHTTASPRSSHGDPMQTTPPSSVGMGPPNQNSPDVEHGGSTTNGGSEGTPTHVGQTLGAAAVATSSGPKVVQTAFIHKLYNMLEDRNIQHLISWSNTNESFVMSPSNEFSKVLAQYFKHTNISSFVRQLNMYGFHKVSDVFHTGSPDSTLWEFKHGNGSFKKGDLMGLRDIKRRASRHTLIHRDSFSGQKPGISQPGTPVEPIQDSIESRLMNLEHAFYDVHARLARTEDSYALMSSRVQALTESLVRCHQWTNGVSHAIQSLAPAESPLYADIVEMQKEISRQIEQVRALENPHDALLIGRQPFFSNMSLDGGPMSPRDMTFDQSRRSSIQLPEPPRLGGLGRQPPVPPIPAQYASSPRRLGSISGAGAHPSPGFSRPPLPGPQPPPHPLSSVLSPLAPNLARRHTSADIREHGWSAIPNVNVNANTNGSPYASGNSSVAWPPSSPHHAPADQALRDQLASYEMNGPRRQTVSIARQPSPPPPSGSSGLGVEGVGWNLSVSKFPRPGFELHSAPATRRSSMASNVHSLLNPAETVERSEEEGDGVGPNDERKRKRVQ